MDDKVVNIPENEDDILAELDGDEEELTIMLDDIEEPSEDGGIDIEILEDE